VIRAVADPFAESRLFLPGSFSNFFGEILIPGSIPSEVSRHLTPYFLPPRAHETGAEEVESSYPHIGEHNSNGVNDLYQFLV